jgi:hypothetical protein
MEATLGENFSVRGRIESFDRDTAIIKTADGQKISWPSHKLPEKCQIGDEVQLQLTTDELPKEQQETLAKTILNQLLRSDGSPK